MSKFYKTLRHYLGPKILDIIYIAINRSIIIMLLTVNHATNLRFESCFVGRDTSPRCVLEKK